MIINRLDQPLFLDSALRQDLQAQYAIFRVMKAGLADVDLRRVADVGRSCDWLEELRTY